MHAIIPHSANPTLRKKALEVPHADISGRAIQKLIREMKRLLSKEEHGVALAAPQVGEPLRLFIISGRALARGHRSAPDEPEILEATPQGSDSRAVPDQVYINPEIIKMSRGKSDKHEGCLSIRGKWGTVPRAEKMTIRACDEKGTRFTRGASGFLAHIFQHEMDHLEGVLYIDKATKVYDEKERKQ